MRTGKIKWSENIFRASLQILKVKIKAIDATLPNDDYNLW